MRPVQRARQPVKDISLFSILLFLPVLAPGFHLEPALPYSRPTALTLVFQAEILYGVGQ
jgi:hypothetical protein